MVINSKFFQQLTKSKYMAYIKSLPNFHEEKVQTYATIILSFFAFSFFGLFAITPTLSTIVTLNKTLDDNKFVDKQLQTKISNMTQLQEQYNSVAPNLTFLYAAIPQSAKAPELMGQIRAVAEEEGVTLVQIQFQTASLASTSPTTDKLSPFIVTLTAEGEYQKLVSFYQSLNGLNRLISFTSLTFVLPPETDNYRLSTQALAYFEN